MKILYDHQIFSIQKYGGISRYFVEVINNLPDNVQPYLGLRYSENVHLQSCQSLFSKKRSGIENILLKSEFKGKARLIYYLNQKLSIEQLKQQNFDVFHPTYYDDYFLNYIGDKPFVLTIHDMIHELFPEMQNKIEADISYKKARLASKAAHIIAVSENTKKDIVDIFGIKPEKISVVYHGSSINKANSSVKPKDLPTDYILYVGERKNYKNFLFMVSAMQPVLNKHKSLILLCTGRDFNLEEQMHIKELNLEKQVQNIFINEADFYNTYYNAKAFIFPSYYEGFGIPIIEAFDCECPAIVSKSSCFPEIAGDAAIYFDPKKKREIVDSVEKILDDQNLRNKLVERGIERLKRFSWTNAASQTSNVYNQAIEQHISNSACLNSQL